MKNKKSKTRFRYKNKWQCPVCKYIAKNTWDRDKHKLNLLCS